MRWHVGAIMLALAACSTSEDKSCDALQYYLRFDAADTHLDEYIDSDTYVVGLHGVAVGGTERVSVTAIDGCGSSWSPGPLIVSDADPSLATVVTTTAPTETLLDIHGLAPGVADVTVTDDAVMMKDLAIGVRAIESVRLVADEVGVPGAFFVGIPRVKVQLLAQGQWIVDRGLTIAGDLPQGTAWNLLETAGAAVGDHAVTVNAGGKSWPVTAKIVDHIDDIVAGTPKDAVPNRSKQICFYAHTDGAEVAGVPWMFDLEPDGGAVVQPNCVTVWPRDTNETSTTVTAHALGLTTSTTVTFPR